jgi:hypothetical protein
MITAERLRKLLHYDPETGVFTWRMQRGPAAAGAVAGSPHRDGYVCIGIDGRWYLAHRLAWLYMSGEWPENQIDHHDGKRSNNRIANLRPATHAQNQMNSRAYGQSGRKGVSWNRGRWQARIRVNRVLIHLGRFDDKEEAAAAYALHARKHFGEFARAGRTETEKDKP